MCDYRIGRRDTGQRKRDKDYTQTVWAYVWVATCGASGGPFESKTQAVQAALRHTGSCTK